MTEQEFMTNWAPKQCPICSKSLAIIDHDALLCQRNDSSNHFAVGYTWNGLVLPWVGYGDMPNRFITRLTPTPTLSIDLFRCQKSGSSNRELIITKQISSWEEFTFEGCMEMIKLANESLAFT
jgi:hypothetical protein